MSGVWRRLGLPGVVDAHTHFLPPSVTAKVRHSSTGPGR